MHNAVPSVPGVGWLLTQVNVIIFLKCFPIIIIIITCI